VHSYLASGIVKTLYELDGGDKLIQQRKNENRLIEIDRYYIAKYKAETKVLQVVIFFCCLALIGSILYNKEIISLLMYTTYVGFISLIMLLVIGRDMYNIFIRDSTNFDEIDYTLSYRPVIPDISSNINYNTGELSNLPSCPS
jgi:hypothetical protein